MSPQSSVPLQPKPGAGYSRTLLDLILVVVLVQQRRDHVQVQDHDLEITGLFGTETS